MAFTANALALAAQDSVKDAPVHVVLARPIAIANTAFSKPLSCFSKLLLRYCARRHVANSKENQKIHKRFVEIYQNLDRFEFE